MPSTTATNARPGASPAVIQRNTWLSSHALDRPLGSTQNGQPRRAGGGQAHRGTVGHGGGDTGPATKPRDYTPQRGQQRRAQGRQKPHVDAETAGQPAQSDRQL